MPEHKHAWFLRALADGVPLDEFEVEATERFTVNGPALVSLLLYPDRWEIRRKPRTIKIGSRDVPAPPEKMPEVGQKCFLIQLSDVPLVPFTWRAGSTEKDWFKSGRIRMTQEDAEAVRQALLEVLKGGE